MGDDKTWEGKSSTFKEENAYTEGGKLVLRVDKNEDQSDDESDGSDE